MKRITHFASLLVLGCPILLAQDYSTAPAGVQAALFVKILAFDRQISAGGEVTIHVVDAPDVARELKRAVGMSIGAATLKSVSEGPDIPPSKPTAVYLADVSNLRRILNYTRTNKVLSMTGSPPLVPQGATLGVGIGGDGKPKILVNLSSSKEEGADWNPAILKTAVVF